ncbi:MAG: phosphatase PAP2 family protein [Rhodobacteraceae bacterium]|nr:phosphatase PAP2 family protein [Paracoccaceae bacterium]
MDSHGGASPLRAFALAATHDATVGYWDGLATSDTPHELNDPDNLEYLSPDRRSQILFGELSSRFRVSGADGNGAKLFLDGGVEVCSIAQPAPEDLAQQLIWVRNYADLRVDRISEIIDQIGDIQSYFGALTTMNPWRRAKTMMLLSLVQSLAIHVEMQFKHYCWGPRPADYTQQVQPIIQTPDHSTFPSGHSTEAHALATVLHRLLAGQGAAEAVEASEMPMAFRIAHRIAVNRTVAGVHFPVDSAAGAVLGSMIGEAVHSIATNGAYTSLSYAENDAWLDIDKDFTLGWVRQHLAKAAPCTQTACDGAPLFRRLWNDAKAEWAGGKDK